MFLLTQYEDKIVYPNGNLLFLKLVELLHNPSPQETAEVQPGVQVTTGWDWEECDRISQCAQQRIHNYQYIHFVVGWMYQHLWGKNNKATVMHLPGSDLSLRGESNSSQSPRCRRTSRRFCSLRSCRRNADSSLNTLRWSPENTHTDYTWYHTKLQLLNNHHNHMWTTESRNCGTSRAACSPT